MDRRHFIKTIFSSTLISPLLLKSENTHDHTELYLISHQPENVLPIIFKEIKDVKDSSSFSFSSFHPREKEISHVLAQNGWKKSFSSRSDITFLYRLLNKKESPSFTLVKNGQVRDIRSVKLYSLWQQMSSSSSLSSELTIVSINSNSVIPGKGRQARVLIEGRPVETLSINNTTTRSYRVKSGEIILKVKNQQVEIIDSCCRKKICLHTPPIKLAGERIICAPNRFMVELKGSSLIDTIIG